LKEIGERQRVTKVFVGEKKEAGEINGQNLADQASNKLQRE
jgi:hypothetical protein